MSEQKLTLTVPIRVYSIYQAEDEAVIGPEVDFESLPYFDKELQLDMNSDVPYLAESVISRPFEDTNFLLKKGVHLNWDFPQFLKTTAYGAENSNEFPPVPTRWLVSRYTKDSKGKAKTLEANWIVESDALVKNLKGAKIYDMAQTSLPVDINSGERPYTYMGRIEKMEEWKNRAGKPGKKYSDWFKEHGEKESLTAMGWGSMSFDVFYPNCRGVFGLHDPDGTEDHIYKVVGWYHRIEEDYWKTYLNKKKGKYGFSEIDQLEHLEEKRKEELKKNQFIKAIKDDFGIDFKSSKHSTTLSSSDSWERMICCGESHFLEDYEPNEKDLRFALGNTPIEALSAMLAEHPAMGGLEGAAREKLEDSLSAMLMGDRLKSKKLDIGPKFREFRHADEFVASDGGLRWIIEKVSDDPQKKTNDGEKNDKKLMPPLPKTLLPFLEDLNAIQGEYDRVKAELESCRFELYSDWYRYMHAAYPPPGETEEYFELSELRAMIRGGSLHKVSGLKKLLGDKGIKNRSGLAHKVKSAKEKLQKEIDQLNEEIKKAKNTYLEEFHWEIQSRPASRFWEPTPPALVIALPRKNQPKKKADGVNADSTELKKMLNCGILENAGTKYTAKDFSGQKILKKSGINWTVPNDPFSTDLPIFKGEWEVEVYSVATKHPTTKSSGKYDSEFITTNYQLGENEPDLDDNPAVVSMLASKPSGSIYAGSAFVNQKLDDRYRSLLKTYDELQNQRIEALKKELDTIKDKKSGIYKNLSSEKKQAEKFLGIVIEAEKFLNSHDLLVVTLDGFNSALLQRHDSIQLNPADPIGFNDFQDFANEVAETLKNNFKGASPDPHTPFLPIRSGALDMIAIRLVDIFGRYTELIPDNVSTAVSMYVPVDGNWVRLPPRISQPARWNFRFLNSESDKKSGQHLESQSHPDSSPVHGWIVPNLLDKTLDFFQPNGSRIGSIIKIDSRIEFHWDIEFLKRFKVESKFEGKEISEIIEVNKQENIISEYLLKIIGWITINDKELEKTKKKDEPSFLDVFMEDIEEAMDNIHPNDREGQSAFSVLMGRPMAIVHLGVDLELKGLPEINVGWNQLHHDLGENKRSTDDFEKVKFPYRLGEYRQRNDGLIGYWLLNNALDLSDEFNVNDAVSGSLDDDEIHKYDPKTGAPRDKAAYKKITKKTLAKIADPLDQWLLKKNQEWKIQDEDGRTLFKYLTDETDNTIKKQDLIQPYIRGGSMVWEALKNRGFLTEEKPYNQIRHYAKADILTINAVEPMQHFIALTDPHGLIHLSSGIQPVKEIQLPKYFVEDALHRIEMTFLTAPILTPEDHLQISLPKEKEYTWFWRERNLWPTELNASLKEVKNSLKWLESNQLKVRETNQVVIKEKVVYPLEEIKNTMIWLEEKSSDSNTMTDEKAAAHLEAFQNTLAWLESNQVSTEENKDDVTPEKLILLVKKLQNCVIWLKSNQWLTKEKNNWLTPEKEIKSFRTVANFPDRVVIREGQLVLKHKTEE